MTDEDPGRPGKDAEMPVDTETDPTRHSNTVSDEDVDSGAYSSAMADEGNTALPSEEKDEVADSELVDDGSLEANGTRTVSTAGAGDEEATRSETAI